MAENIVSGLFGLDPYQIQQQRQAQINAQAQQYAHMQPLERAAAGMYQAGAGLGQVGAGMLGMVDPLQEQAKRQQAAMQGADVTTPQGLRVIAAKFQALNMPQQAIIAAAKANELERESQKILIEQQKQALQERKQTFQEQEAFDLKKQQAKDILEQRAKEAEMRAENMRLSLQQRSDAAKEANATRLQIAQLMASMKTSAMEEKKSESAKKLEEGRSTVDNLVGGLRDYYNQLQEMGGISDPAKGTVSNIVAGIASSGAGQAAGRILGTKAQSIRNSIIQQRPLLLQAIKEATGMSAKQMDSNVELKMYLAASTDPSLDIKSNLAALEKINSLYGLGGKAGKIDTSVKRTFKVLGKE